MLSPRNETLWIPGLYVPKFIDPTEPPEEELLEEPPEEEPLEELPEEEPPEEEDDEVEDEQINLTASIEEYNELDVGCVLITTLLTGTEVFGKETIRSLLPEQVVVSVTAIEFPI